jgi:fibronectin-binding autotransporter adhesin
MKRALRLPAVLTLTLLAAYGVVNPTHGADRTWTGSGSDNNWSTPANWGGAAPTAGDLLFFTGTMRLSNTNDFTPGTLFNGITFDIPAGAFSLGGNSITLGGDIRDNQDVTPQAINLSLALNATRTVDVVTDGLLTLGGVISGSGHGLTKTGGGILTLSATNTFSGTLTVSAGTVSVGSDANLGAAPASPTAGKIALNTGTLRATSSFTMNANRGVELVDEGTFEIGAGLTLTYGGNASGTGGLTKQRFGGLTLSSANSYTGPTTIKNGTVTLDFTQPTSPVNNIISSSSALTLGGANAGFGALNYAQLTMLGKAGAANSQSFNGTHVTFGSSVVLATNGAGGTANLSLGALDHAPGGTLAIVTPALVGGGHVTTTTPNVNGILGGWATISDGSAVTISGNRIVIGTNFASVDGSGNVVNFNGYRVLETGQTIRDIIQPGENLLISSAVTGDMVVDDDNANTVTDVNAINWNRTDGNVTLRVGIGNTLRLGRHGSIFKPNTTAGLTWLIGQTAAGGNGPDQDIGTLTAGGADNTPGEIIVHANSTSSSSGTIIIDCKITDNGTGPVTFVKTGPGSMKLRGHNTHSGGTYLLQGRVQFVGGEGGVGTGNADAGGTGPIYILPGCYLFPSGTAPAEPVTNEVFIAGNGTAGEPLGAIRMSSSWVFTGPWTLIGDTTIGGNGGISGALQSKISGPFSLALCSRATVNGTVALANPENEWTGTTIMQARSNQGNNTFANGNSEVIPNGFGKGNVVMEGFAAGTIAWNLNGFSETINGLSTFGNGATCTIVNNGATPSALTIGDNDQSGTFAGLINNGSAALALRKIGGGKETLTAVNNYTGATTIEGGTLALSGSGSIASSERIVINGGTLDVTDIGGAFVYNFPVEVNNGALALRNTASPGIASLSLADSRVRVTSVGSTPIVIDTTALTTDGATNLIDVASVGNVISYPAQFTIIKYPGAIGGAGFNFGLGNVPTASTVGYISNNVANSSVDLVLLDGPKPLTWTGTGGNNDWDINTTVNWRAFAGTPNATPSVYIDVDLVRFDDTAGANNIVDLTTTLLPGTVVVSNETVTYTFIGTGKLSGPTGLTKEGAGTLILDGTGTNDFFGPMSINSGTVQVGNNSTGGSLGAGVVANNATLAFARSDDANIATAISGNGTVRQDGPGVLTLSGNSTFTGPTVVAQSTLKPGGPGAFGTADSPTRVESGATLDVNGLNMTGEPVVVQGSGVGGRGAIVNGGAEQQSALRTVTLAGDTTFGGTSRWDIRNTGGPAALNSGAPHKITKVGTNQVSLVGVVVDMALGEIDVQEGTFSVQTTTTQLGDANAVLNVQSGATLGLFNLNAVPLQKKIALKDSARVWSESGSNIINGEILLEGIARFDVANAGTAPTLILNGELTGGGGLVKVGAGRMVMNGGFNSYSGATTVSNGTLLVDGIYADFTPFTVEGGTVGGVGTITGPLIVNAGGTVAPGNVATPVGTLMMGGAVTLSGTTSMDLNKGGSVHSDSLTTLDTITFGGTLRLNVTGEALAPGDSFTLFTFGSATGAFSALVPAAPGPGWRWNTNDLATSGILSVEDAQLRFSTVSQSGTNLVMSGAGGNPNGSYEIRTSTDLNVPTSQWSTIASGMFDGNGRFSVEQGIDPATPKRFFLILVP